MSVMRYAPKGYGGQRRDPEAVKGDGWRDQGLLAVSLDDHRLTWPEVVRTSQEIAAMEPHPLKVRPSAGAGWSGRGRHGCRGS